MFDLISGGPRHPFHDRTSAPVVVSVALLGVAIALLLIFSNPFLAIIGAK